MSAQPGLSGDLPVVNYGGPVPIMKLWPDGQKAYCNQNTQRLNPYLADDDIHVWRLSLVSFTSDFERLRLVLSSDERGRAERYKFEVDRRRSVIRRGCLRLLLGKTLKIPADNLRFEYEDFGKPRLM